MNYLTKIINIFYYIFASPENYGRHIGVKIGNKCKISTKLFSSEPFLIEIGDNCRIAKEVLFLTHGGIWHLRNLYPELKDIDYYGKIKVGNNVYIGQRTIIMPGVTIEDNCVVGAASIVNRSIKSNSVVAGNPIRYISDLDNYITKLKTRGLNIHNKNQKIKNMLIKNLNEGDFFKREFLN